MSRDDFEKLANCANNNEACRNDIFNDTNPYNISSNPGFVLVLNQNIKAMPMKQSAWNSSTT